MASITHPIPTNYDELYAHFMPFIADEVRKRNTVAHNFDDLLQEVWCSLMKARVIERFHEYASDSTKAVPETMTTLEACEFIGITLKQWASRNWIVRKGYKDKTTGKVRRVSYTLPAPLSGGYSSPKAIYNGEDIVNVANDDEIIWTHRQPSVIPNATKKPTTYMFMNYLGRAVLNHFNNFCRTRNRKWKDRTGDTLHTAPATRPKKVKGADGKVIEEKTDENVQYTAFPKSRLGNNAPQFHLEDGAYNTHWEDTIHDSVSEARIEAQVALSQTLDQLEKRGVNVKDREIVALSLIDGYTITEALNRTGMTDIRKKAFERLFATG